MGSADRAGNWVRGWEKMQLVKHSTLNITNPLRRMAYVQKLPPHAGAALALR
jgi:hypothetical protein